MFYKSIRRVSPLAAAAAILEDNFLSFFFFCRNQRLSPGTTSKQGLIIFSRVAAIIGEAEQTPASLIASAHLFDRQTAPERLIAANLDNLVGSPCVWMEGGRASVLFN